MFLSEFLKTSYTSFHAVENVEKLLLENGFVRLSEGEPWRLVEGGKYFVTRSQSAICGFRVGSVKNFYAKIVASHTDSPCLKIKENPVIEGNGVQKLNVEGYGGGIWYSFFDRPLKIAGRVVVKEGEKLISKRVVSDYTLVIPSLAIHMNRTANEGFSVNPQVDLLPLLGLASTQEFFKTLTSEKVLSHELFLVPAQEPFLSGANNEFLSSPRIDNLTSVLSSFSALIGSEGEGILLAAAFDNEEVGSSSFSGAGSDFLKNIMKKIGLGLSRSSEEITSCGARSFLLSLDNAHAIHPNHPEKCDLTNHPVLGGGLVIKNHAGKAYTTDARSSAVLKDLFEQSQTPYQTFYNRSDMRSGGTLGSISLSEFGVLSADLGIAQLAMHSAVETMALADYDAAVKGLTAFYRSSLRVGDEEIEVRLTQE